MPPRSLPERGSHGDSEDHDSPAPGPAANRCRPGRFQVVDQDRPIGTRRGQPPRIAAEAQGQARIIGDLPTRDLEADVDVDDRDERCRVRPGTVGHRADPPTAEGQSPAGRIQRDASDPLARDPRPDYQAFELLPRADDDLCAPVPRGMQGLQRS